MPILIYDPIVENSFLKAIGPFKIIYTDENIVYVNDELKLIEDNQKFDFGRTITFGKKFSFSVNPSEEQLNLNIEQGT